MSRRTSMGRQKIEIKKIDREDALQVTFSKRRAGVFKKASELCILCGAEAAIVVFSPSGKAFSFGHPLVDSVIDKYLSGNNNNISSPHSESSRLTQMIDAHREGTAHELNREYTDLVNQLETERKKEAELAELAKASQRKFWWEAPIKDLDLSQLEQLQAAMERLQTDLTTRANELFEIDLFSEPFDHLLAGPDQFVFEEGDIIGPSSSTIPHG